MIDAASTDNSFAEFLGPVAAGVPPALISPAAFADMEAIVRFLPETLANNTFGFDRRMPYATPIPGLYSCSAGCHPAGSVIGAAGYNAARRILRDLT